MATRRRYTPLRSPRCKQCVLNQRHTLSVTAGRCRGALVIGGEWLLVTLRNSSEGIAVAWAAPSLGVKHTKRRRGTAASVVLEHRAERRSSAARRRFTTTESRTLP
jgi:hypothetical protein